jgi:hypothetical protein
MNVAPEPIEVARTVGTAGTLVLHHRHTGQKRPQAAQGLGAVVRWRALDVALAQQQAIEACRLIRERDLRANLEGTWAASLEVSLEADVPDDSLGAHGAICADRESPGKLSTDQSMRTSARGGQYTQHGYRLYVKARSASV